MNNKNIKICKKALEDIMEYPYKNKDEELLDMCIHIKKQKLKINGIKMYQAFDECYKRENGSYKIYLTSFEYYPLMFHRHNCNIDKCWDVVEMKAQYNEEFDKYGN